MSLGRWCVYGYRMVLIDLEDVNIMVKLGPRKGQSMCFFKGI